MADADTRQLRSTWIPALKAIGTPPKPRQPGEFNSQIDRLIDELFDGLLHEVLPLIGDENKAKAQQRAERFKEKIRTQDSGHSKQVKEHYLRVHAQWKNLRTIRKQEDWATTRDYIKMYLSRTLQAATIALIVLGTAYLAKIWHIPLPFWRVAA